MSTTRMRSDRCPGVSRPWPADDGLLVRLRLIGGRISAPSLQALCDVAVSFGDGRIHVTSRANLQLRGLPATDGVLTSRVHDALAATGLLPSRTHELVRNIMMSPLTGWSGGRADLRPVADDLDWRVLADEPLAALPGRFLFVLDDGRGDLLGRSCDLGLVALDKRTAQLRVGKQWGAVVPLVEAAVAITALAREFLDRRGNGPSAAWHVTELDRPLIDPVAADARVAVPSPALPFGDVPGGRHIPVGKDGLDAEAARGLADEAPELIVTPWRGIFVPREIHD